ncbi:hypothetical protein Tco_1505050 [Tanacetum coccineum]
MPAEGHRRRGPPGCWCARPATVGDGGGDLGRCGIGRCRGAAGGKYHMPPKRTSTSEAPVMTQAAIKKLVAASVAAALEAQAATMASTNNPNSGPRKTPVARKCTYDKFTSYQPFYFNGTEGAVSLIRWFKWIESVFSRRKCADKNKVKFAVNTLIEEALFWCNSFT